MGRAARQFAIVTGASTGIGFDLARECAEHGFDLLIAADEPEINEAAAKLQLNGLEVRAVQADLTDEAGVEKLYAAVAGRPVDALLANAGRGLGRAFLDQNPHDWMRVGNTNITGTLLLVQKVGRDMRQAGSGRIIDHRLYRRIHAGHLSITAPRHFSTASPSLFGMSCGTAASASPV